MIASYSEIKNQLYAAVIADILDDLGYRDQVMAAGIRPLDPEQVLVGRARTMLAVPEFTIPARPYDLQIDAVDALQAGDVVVAHTSNITDSAFWGELFSTAVAARGGTGAVMDGYVRDVRKIIEMKFPVFAAGLRPLNSKGRCTVTAYDIPVRCGGVLVHPGDLIFAEIDGVVVIPQAVSDEVITRALETASRENEMRHELLHGASLRSAWEKYQVL
jgi:4-hydroxy-4-methyl-2-oxoglutarate aldolase